MQQEIILKKNIIGGFNRKQVTQCLLQLKSECNETLSADYIADIKNTIDNLTAILNDKTDQTRLLKELLESLKRTDCEDRITMTKSISKSEKNIEKAKSQAEEIKKKTKNEIESKSVKLEIMFSKIHLIGKETERIKGRLTQTLDRLSEIQINTDIEEVNNQHEKVQTVPIEEVITIKGETLPENEPENVIESYEDNINIISEDTQESINSIDNFFAELYKMTNGKLFEPRPLPKSDTDDDFEYEY